MKPKLLTAANGLSIIRVLIAGPCAYAILTGRAWPAALGFAVAVVTDLLDGPVARRREEASPLGGLIDHASDAFFVTVTLGALAATGAVPFVLAPLVAAAFVQYMLDSKALAGRELRASALGRYNGIAYFVLAGTVVVRDALVWSFPPDGGIMVAAWVLVATTIVSIADRLRALIASRSES